VFLEINGRSQGSEILVDLQQKMKKAKGRVKDEAHITNAEEEEGKLV